MRCARRAFAKPVLHSPWKIIAIKSKAPSQGLFYGYAFGSMIVGKLLQSFPGAPSKPLTYRLVS